MKTHIPPQKFPWVALFQLALSHGMQPEAVWAMTPAEIMALLDVATINPLGRDELHTLMAQYPDMPASGEVL